MSLHSFCPSCDKIPYIEINTKEVYLNCDHCQFNSLNNYLQQVKDIKPSIVAQSNRKIDKLKEVIKLAHNHLTNYFSKIKSERITSLLNQIQLIESEYQKSYTDNKNVISLLEVLINNYSNQYGRMFNNILSNSNLNIYECPKEEIAEKEKGNLDYYDKNNDSNLTLINYFTNYEIIIHYNNKDTFTPCLMISTKGL